MAKRKRLHLISNAHIDPVWLWEWEEGAAEAISTFRSAADICEENPSFIFNHNEVILYQWVEEYEPGLFRRIQELVKAGKWRIMGGWFLQPDCNMPCGESFVRQILAGRRYFAEKFGVRPTVAMNLDPFGHTRGLVQIMAKSGFDSYLIVRPYVPEFELPEDNVVTWVGFDGSEVLVQRAPLRYTTRLGKVQDKLDIHLAQESHREVQHFLWGVGNHGGGPSRQDLATIDHYARENPDIEFIHSTLEDFFADLRSNMKKSKRLTVGLNPTFIGCYTSQIRIKQKHRQLENELYATERMCAAASVQGLMQYPREELNSAQRDLMVAQFHDILPGSSIQPVENASLRLMDHGLETLSRVKARAFFALATGQPKAEAGEIPILVYNPHPFDLDTIVECEFQLIDQNKEESFTLPRLYSGRKELPLQVEKEESNLNLDWRKRVVFRANLKAGQMNRFDCRFEVLPRKPEATLDEKNGRIHFQSERLDVVINTRTGLMDAYRVDGRDYLSKGAFQPLVVEDNEDPWGMFRRRFGKTVGKFKLLPPERGTAISGVRKETIKSVRVIEDGPVRSVVEAVLGWNDSTMILTYRLPKAGSEIEMGVRVFWNEKNRLLKLSIPTVEKRSSYWGEVAFGRERLATNGDEAVAQKWTGVVSSDGKHALTVINDGIYGSDCSRGNIRLSLLRSPCYAAHPIMDRELVPQDRFLPRIDQGERVYTFWIQGGKANGRLDSVSREAQAKGEAPFALSFSPAGIGKKAAVFVTLSDDVVQLTAIKKSETGNDLVVRLFEPTGKRRSTVLRLNWLKKSIVLRFDPFEVKTLLISPESGDYVESNLIEEAKATRRTKA